MKKLLSVIGVAGALLMGVSEPVKAESNYESGIYEVENDVYHEQEIGMAAARAYLEPTMEVEVRKDKVTYHVGFVANEYMENYRMKVNGEEVDIELSEDEDSVIATLETTSLDDKLEALIYVGPMGRDVDFEVIPLLDTMTLIETIEEPSSNGALIACVGVGAVVLIGAIVVIVKKKK